MQMGPGRKAERRGHGSALGGRGLDTPDTPLKIRWDVSLSNQALRQLDRREGGANGLFKRKWLLAPHHDPLSQPAGGRRAMTQGVRVPGDSTRSIDLGSQSQP